MSNASIPYFHGENTRQSGDTARAGARGRVYFAAPITTYDTPRYERLCDLARAAFPRATLLPARDAFSSAGDWRSRWKAVLTGCAAVVFITDEAGYIGRGVWDEIAFAQARGAPVWWLADDGRLTPYADTRFSPLDEGDWRRYTRVNGATRRGMRHE